MENHILLNEQKKKAIIYLKILRMWLLNALENNAKCQERNVNQTAAEVNYVPAYSSRSIVSAVLNLVVIILLLQRNKIFIIYKVITLLKEETGFYNEIWVGHNKAYGSFSRFIKCMHLTWEVNMKDFGICKSPTCQQKKWNACFHINKHTINYKEHRYISIKLRLTRMWTILVNRF